MTDLRTRVESAFLTSFKNAPDLIVRAPGRINLIGEHTDYNLGLVLPAAIDKCIYFAFKKRDDFKCRVRALDIGEEVILDLDHLRKSEKLWVNYLQGVLGEFSSRKITYRGFDCVFGGSIPLGSGLSSSAALDCGFILGLSSLFGHSLEKWEIVDISNKSNNNYLGINSGILDQFASVFGKKDHCMMLDCQNRNFNYHRLSLNHYRFILINSNVRHEHASSGYNDRPRECKEIIDTFNSADPSIQSLRDVDTNFLFRHKSLISSKLYNRAQFIVEENQRVVDFVNALEMQDMHALGTLLYQSHDGLQYQYEVSCPETDLLVDLTRNEEGVLGARMMGGGFGGCTLNLVHQDHVETMSRDIMNTYQKETGVSPDLYMFDIEDGASIE